MSASGPDVTQAALHHLLATTRAQIEAHAAQLAAGAWSATTFGDRMLETLTNAHARAAYLGRFRAGDTTPPDQDDRRFADLVMREEDEFLGNFEEDLQGGRYLDEHGYLKADRVQARALMYLGRVAGTANETWALTSSGDIWWRLGQPETNHCTDCPALAQGSPYTAQSLPTSPRANQTACLINCLCFLETSDGQRSFAPE